MARLPLELVLDVINFLSFKEKSSLIFVSKFLNTSLMLKLQQQREQILDHKNEIEKREWSMRDQLSSSLRDKYQLEDQRRDLGRQYRDDLTALESLNMPTQQREHQEAALNATYSQQAGTLCQRIEVYQHKIDICRAKLDNFEVTMKFLKSLTNSSHCEEYSLNISDPDYFDIVEFITDGIENDNDN